MKKEPLRYLAAFAILYLIAYAPMLLIPSFWQDDWVWANPALAVTAIKDFGKPFAAEQVFFSIWLDNVLSPFVRVGPFIAFVSFFFAWLCWARFYSLLDIFNRSQIFWITALSALAPFDLSRAQVNLYPVTFLVFSIAALCFIAAVVHRNVFLRVVAALLILISSLLVESLYFASAALFVAVAIIRRDEWFNRGTERWNALAYLAVRHGELFLVPVVSFILRRLFFFPSGIYAGYNGITLAALVKSVIVAPFAALNAVYMVVASVAAFAQPGYAVAGSPKGVFLIIVVVFAVIALLKIGETRDQPDVLARKSSILISLAVAALVIYPYAVVQSGHAPVPLSNFNDRHFLLAQIPLGWFIYGVITWVVRPNLQRYALAVTLSVMTVGTVLGYFGLVRDGHIINGLIASLKTNNEVKRASTVVFIPGQPQLWLGRVTSFYEWNGILHSAYNDYTRLAVGYGIDERWTDPERQIKESVRDFGKYGGYGFQDYTGKGPMVEVQWLVPLQASPLHLVKLSYLHAFAPARYEQSVASETKLIVTPWKQAVH
jgi:hypothetical protein